ncbi:type VI secretion system amidase effector protein Tae4 [Helicobacter cinaedi]|uniref:Type VI secretion system amidase effector protein Tae4 n=1 Tax=Helicobacter cinaedi CCUG 18818 = ATCC BAA-847 TaxID=537971 RepID=A0AAI8MNI6_9HELI|nr:type VI secretion system amidase effector protein Tae4 [Helicobacter cinaedi]EFR47709.1 hypothetical protein HCCG_02258 [Helicobacter cinaedi CCUG 18818 = ATCC BAA-847]QOQ91319.1 type VI secretion system amidase effector protein Tae4 [Helicobacter cinaedi]BAM32766.1 hypothetical protein HCBAA847_1536 [Helicobacter cinaedi CCUG 18818 = ATCC BAA-847]
MSEILTATCGNKSTSIECKRPSWASVRKAYAEVNEIFKKLKIQGKTDKECAEAVFKHIGGEPYKEFLSNEALIKRQKTQGIKPNEVQRESLNSCALRISYALNYSYLLDNKYLIKNKKLPINTGNLKYENQRFYGADSNLYYLGIYGIRNFLTLNWGNSDKPYNIVTFSNASQTKKFYDEKFSQFGKSGIVVMRIKGFSDARGHTTLWNGASKTFEDSAISNNYLNGKYEVKDFQFWELK